MPSITPKEETSGTIARRYWEMNESTITGHLHATITHLRSVRFFICSNTRKPMLLIYLNNHFPLNSRMTAEEKSRNVGSNIEPKAELPRYIGLTISTNRVAGASGRTEMDMTDTTSTTETMEMEIMDMETTDTDTMDTEATDKEAKDMEAEDMEVMDTDTTATASTASNTDTVSNMDTASTADEVGF
ncbi:hypothetical protein Hte_007745 [Hypoxylon texense]